MHVVGSASVSPASLELARSRQHDRTPVRPTCGDHCEESNGNRDVAAVDVAEAKNFSAPVLDSITKVLEANVIKTEDAMVLKCDQTVKESSEPSRLTIAERCNIIGPGQQQRFCLQWNITELPSPRDIIALCTDDAGPTSVLGHLKGVAGMTSSGEAMWLLDFSTLRIPPDKSLRFRYYNSNSICLAQSELFQPFSPQEQSSAKPLETPAHKPSKNVANADLESLATPRVSRDRVPLTSDLMNVSHKSAKFESPLSSRFHKEEAWGSKKGSGKFFSWKTELSSKTAGECADPKTRTTSGEIQPKPEGLVGIKKKILTQEHRLPLMNTSGSDSEVESTSKSRRQLKKKRLTTGDHRTKSADKEYYPIWTRSEEDNLRSVYETLYPDTAPPPLPPRGKHKPLSRTTPYRTPPEVLRQHKPIAANRYKSDDSPRCTEKFAYHPDDFRPLPQESYSISVVDGNQSVEMRSAHRRLVNPEDAFNFEIVDTDDFTPLRLPVRVKRHSMSDPKNSVHIVTDVANLKLQLQGTNCVDSHGPGGQITNCRLEDPSNVDPKHAKTSTASCAVIDQAQLSNSQDNCEKNIVRHGIVKDCKAGLKMGVGCNDGSQCSLPTCVGQGLHPGLKAGVDCNDGPQCSLPTLDSQGSQAGLKVGVDCNDGQQRSLPIRVGQGPHTELKVGVDCNDAPQCSLPTCVGQGPHPGLKAVDDCNDGPQCSLPTRVGQGLHEPPVDQAAHRSRGDEARLYSRPVDLGEVFHEVYAPLATPEQDSSLVDSSSVSVENLLDDDSVFFDAETLDDLDVSLPLDSRICRMPVVLAEPAPTKPERPDCHVTDSTNLLSVPNPSVQSLSPISPHISSSSSDNTVISNASYPVTADTVVPGSQGTVLVSLASESCDGDAKNTSVLPDEAVKPDYDASLAISDDSLTSNREFSTQSVDSLATNTLTNDSLDTTRDSVTMSEDSLGGDPRLAADGPTSSRECESLARDVFTDADDSYNVSDDSYNVTDSMMAGHTGIDSYNGAVSDDSLATSSIDQVIAATGNTAPSGDDPFVTARVPVIP